MANFKQICRYLVFRESSGRLAFCALAHLKTEFTETTEKFLFYDDIQEEGVPDC